MEPPLRDNRKRAIEDIRDPDEPSSKRRQISRPSIFELSNSAPDNTALDNADSDNPIEFWRREGRWPRRYFEPEMEHLLARKRSFSALGSRKRTNSASSTTPSDQKPREGKSAQYRDPRYETLLATKGSFLVKSKLDIATESKTLCKKLLEGEQALPENSLFRDDLFDLTCQKIHNRNEARVIRDISRLIVPSAESLATYGAEHIEILTESVNEGWNNSIPLTGTRPQSDYAVGFLREAFTKEQLGKLAPFIGDFLGGDVSFFMATYYMYFPFLACEVKCGAAALDVADRENAHSMTLAARGIAELFRLVGREDEIHRQIIAFSVSHDHQSVRIYGYYPVIDGKDIKYYRHPIRNFSFTELDGKEKWTAYRFTKNIYDHWVPAHFKRVCSVIDQLPSKVDFDVQALSESTGPSQGLESLARLEDTTSLLIDDDNKAGPAGTPATSFSKPAPAKRRKSPVKRPKR
ncbi:reverse transcriptase [Cordyceps javanica]|uniref:Reverse transcriptase n=1 Tax=Cordyceps javanica TaxID=43265 RepID=A0A545UMD2_9HYPO|nr:reverse transcriptase [Cordyceps javanica]TQW02074.1 reverse transcriptase [Cordyceps javanica]